MNLLSLLFLFVQTTHAFESLKSAEFYAKNHEENPRIENANVLQPVFSEFHRTMRPSFFSHIMARFQSEPQWHPGDLAVVLSDLLKTKNALFTQKVLTVKPRTQLIVLGPLYGAFHSLVRVLAELQKRGLIDNSFTLKPDTYLVFLGNVIDKSPYTLETLSLVLSLIQKNPQKVIYMKGYHEFDHNWKGQELHAELIERAPEHSDLPEKLVSFFDALPQTVNLFSGPDDKNLIALQSLKEFDTADNVWALIKPEMRLIHYGYHPGLAPRETRQGSTTWSLFSSPIRLYQEYFKFYLDAFAILTIKKPLIDSTITLYNRDVRGEKGFEKRGQWNVVTAQEIVEGKQFRRLSIEQGTVDLSVSLDLSRSSRTRGRNVAHGISAAVNRINSNGGINNKLLRVFIKDDGYQASQARQNIESFIKKGNPLLLAPLGTQTLKASLNLIKENKVYVFFPLSGSFDFRKPDLTSLINMRSDYNFEAAVLTEYVHKKLLGKNFAFFYQNDSYGIEPLRKAQSVLKKMGITNSVEASYQTNTLRITEAAETILKANPDVIALFSLSAPTIALLKALGVEFLATKKLFGLSPLGEEAFQKFLDNMGLKVTFAQAVPNPLTSEIEIVKEYRNEIKKFGFNPSTYSLEGYINASVAADLLKKVKGPLTIQSVGKIVENVKNYSFKGLSLNYNPKNRQLAHTLWIDTGKGEWIAYDTRMIV